MGDYVIASDFGVTLKDFNEIDTRAVKKIIIKKGKDEDEGDLITLELHDKLKATELIGKHIGAFSDKLDVTTKGKKLPDSNTVNKIIINHRRKGEQISKEDEKGS